MPLFKENMPVPEITPDTREFWEACREHRLVVQRCAECQAFRFAPSPICHHCHSPRYDNVESRGVGEIYTWTVTHRAVHPAVVDRLPFNVVVVRLADCGGTFITSNLVEAPVEALRPGLAVEVVWERINAEITLPRFRPLPQSSA